MEFSKKGAFFTFNYQHVALTDGKREYTYFEVYKIVVGIINLLKYNNIQRLGIYSNNSLEWCFFYLACFFGDIKVILFPKHLSEEELLKQCQEYKINAIMTEESALKGNLGKRIDLPKDYNISLVKFNEDMKNRELDGVSTVLFSSGTTGNSKGIMLTANNIISNMMSISQYMKYSNNDKFLIVKQLTYSSALTAELIAGLYSGATLYILNEGFNPIKTINILNEEKISVFFAVPTIYSSLVRYASKYKGNLRAVSVSGSYLDNQLAREIKETFGCDVYHVYGLSEASPRVTYLAPEYFDKKIGSIGKPIPNVDVKLVDSNGEWINNCYTTGELVVKGNNIMKGYYCNKQLTKEVIKDGYLYTGDLGYQDDEGFIFLCGRKDDMIVRGGINIWPLEIEEVIKKIEYVCEVVVIGVEDYHYSQRIVAFVVSDTKIDTREIIKVCLDHKVLSPDHIEQVDSIPKNSNGKVSKSSLRKIWFQNQGQNVREI